MNPGSDQLPDFTPGPEEDQIFFLERIKFRVDQLLAEDSGLLFSYLYRMDIDENKLQEILLSVAPENLSTELAKEILQRQMMRIKNKNDIKVPPIKEEGWEF